MTELSYGVLLFDRWTALWNGTLDIAFEIMADNFVLRYAQPATEPMDAVHSPDQIVRLIAGWRAMRGEPVFRTESEALVEQRDGYSGRVARAYSCTIKAENAPPRSVSGIDVLRYDRGRIVEVLSASGGLGGRAFGLEKAAK